MLEDTNDIGFQAVEVKDGFGAESGVWFRLALGGITGHKDFARDTGVIVKHYLRALTNAGMPRPRELPFAHLLEKVELEETPDPQSIDWLRTIEKRLYEPSLEREVVDIIGLHASS